MPIEIKRIDHVAIICSNYAKSKEFYTEILGFKVIDETYRVERDSYKLDLALPSGEQLELFSFPNPPRRVSHPEACGLRHLAFVVDNVEKTRANLNAYGLESEPIRHDELTGKNFFFIFDPDGLPIEFYERH
jgi:glyoxylase I family protein